MYGHLTAKTYFEIVTDVDQSDKEAIVAAFTKEASKTAGLAESKFFAEAQTGENAEMKKYFASQDVQKTLDNAKNAECIMPFFSKWRRVGFD